MANEKVFIFKELKASIGDVQRSDPAGIKSLTPTQHIHTDQDDGTIHMWHGKSDSTEGLHSASKFELERDGLYAHTLTAKGPHPDSSKIYSNIRHVLNQEGAVKSDRQQSKGGKKLWQTLHNHVDGKYGVIQPNDQIQKVKDFSDDRHYYAPSQFIIGKKKS